MSLTFLLSHLDGIRETGHGKYVARCPAHDDRSPSLAIKDCDDGRVLVHCFAGCETEDVLSAIGLTFSDVMPERIGKEHSYKPVRQRFDARQVLAGVSHEVTVVVLLAERYAPQMSHEDETRLRLAAERITAGISAAPSLRTPPEIRQLRRGAFQT
jgi:hypothetical protein